MVTRARRVTVVAASRRYVLLPPKHKIKFPVPLNQKFITDFPLCMCAMDFFIVKNNLALETTYIVSLINFRFSEVFCFWFFSGVLTLKADNWGVVISEKIIINGLLFVDFLVQITAYFLRY